MCNMAGVTHSDEPTGNYHPTLQFPSSLQSVLVSFSSWFTTLLFWFTLTALINLVSRHGWLLFSAKSHKNPTVRYLHSIKLQMDKVSD